MKRITAIIERTFRQLPLIFIRNLLFRNVLFMFAHQLKH